MFLVGRVFASGARLFLAGIAVSMILFLDIAPGHILLSVLAMLVLALAFTLIGGLHSVIWSDLIQVTLYVGAALIALVILWTALPMSTAEALAALDRADKLAPVDLRFDLSAPWSIFAVVTGVTLLNLANSGLDQDTTQRLLACRDARHASRSLYAFVWLSLPVILVFLAIGSLLWLTYEGSAAPSAFRGEKVTVFMYWILTELPHGLRGLAAVGVIAAAALNSELIAMAAVVVGDFYRPWAEKRGRRSEAHFVRAGRIASVLIGLVLAAMAMLSYYWQRYADSALLDFVLGVMAFAYSGLLGVYGVALWTRRGSPASVIAALGAGFVTVLAFQPWIVDTFGLPPALRAIAFPWQLCLGTAVAAAVCALGKPRANA
jgi:Na+/proline symporter